MRTIPLLILAILPLAGCTGAGTAGPPKPPQWRADREPLLKRFPFLGDFQSCSWEGGVAVDGSEGLIPGPSSLYIRGFVRLKPEDKQALLDRYKWEEAPEPGFPGDPPADSGLPEIAGAVLESNELMSKLNSMSSFCIGKILLVPESDMLYFDLREL